MTKLIYAIDSALQYYQDYHFDAVERWYYSHQITDTDRTNKYIQLQDSDKIIGMNSMPSGLVHEKRIEHYNF